MTSSSLNQLSLNQLKKLAQENEVDISKETRHYEDYLIGLISEHVSKLSPNDLEKFVENSIINRNVTDITENQFRTAIALKVKTSIVEKACKLRETRIDESSEGISTQELDHIIGIPGLLKIISEYVPSSKDLKENLVELSKQLLWHVDKLPATKGIPVSKIEALKLKDHIPKNLACFYANLESKSFHDGFAYLTEFTQRELNTPVLYGVINFEAGGPRWYVTIGIENRVTTWGDFLNQLYEQYNRVIDEELPENFFVGREHYLKKPITLRNMTGLHQGSFLNGSICNDDVYFYWRDGCGCKDWLDIISRE